MHGQTDLKREEKLPETKLASSFEEDYRERIYSVLLEVTLPEGFSRMRSLNIDCDSEVPFIIVNSQRFGDSYLNGNDQNFIMLTSEKMSVRRKQLD